MGLYDAPSWSTFKVERFKGIDVSVPEEQAKAYRAADMLNMIPDAIGEVRKRPGIQFEKALTEMRRHGKDLAVQLPTDVGTIVEMIDATHPIFLLDGVYSIYALTQSENELEYVLLAQVDRRPTVVAYGNRTIVFLSSSAGTTGGIPCTAAMAVFNGLQATVYTDTGKRYTNNGKAIWPFDVWYGARIKPDDALLTCPTILIVCDTAGGGSPLEAINLLSPWVTESFQLTTNTTRGVFYLNDQALDGTERMDGANAGQYFKVEVLKVLTFTTDANEEVQRACWVERSVKAGDGYNPTANRIFLAKANNGSITYTDEDGTVIENVNVGNEDAEGWIGATPIEGEDNVRITHWRAGFQAEFQKLCQCVCGTVYGIGGHKDRLFLGGGGDWSGRVYYSEMEDPFYIGDLNYIKLEEGVSVMALDGVGDTMTILTDKGVSFTSGKATEGEVYTADALFAVTARIPAPKPLNYNNTAVLGGEIVYLSTEGVIAVTSKDNYSERYAEHRSAMANRRLLADGPKRLLSLGRFLLVFCEGGICWLLDENQPNSEGNKPYASHQYECFRMDGFDADCVFEEDGVLKLVRGVDVYRWTDGSKASHYHDGTEKAIQAFWETPWIFCSDFKKKKGFRKLGVLLGLIDGVDSAVEVKGCKNDEDWKTIWNYDGSLCTLSIDNLDFQFFTFAGAPGNPIINRKIKVKKALRFKLRFTNEIFDQALTLRGFSLDYVQGN